MADATTNTGFESVSLDMYYINKEEGHLTMDGGLALLSPYGISSKSALNRAIREQGVPVRGMSPRKRYFVEAELRTWITRRTSISLVKSNHAKAKVVAKQRSIVRAEKNARKPEPTPAEQRQNIRLDNKVNVLAQ